ncbi:hypothetical protein BDZ97DRAFT_1754835 [Flammula alnicola]|nr:hypothetical protein BDZ97DRAFT_1754835 [Flammula alnicola]
MNILDRSTTLCLACSSSLPPLKGIASSSLSAKLDLNAIFITKCCQRPICPSCIASNPRLARYDPCLACLGGVGVVASSSGSVSNPMPALPGSKTPRTPDTNLNLDGAVRDEDTFILGDDDDDDELDGQPLNGSPDDTPPPPYELTVGLLPNVDSSSSPRKDVDTAEQHLRLVDQDQKPAATEDLSLAPAAPPPPQPTEEETTATSATPYKYYINRSDTLSGISLRFGIDSYEICKLNNLPASVMRTTPHLLHTRAFLLLPLNAKTLRHASPTSNEAEEESTRKREEKLVRERAEKKLQTLTKEVDWRVARAYVALADDPQQREAHSAKLKEMGSSSGFSGPASGSASENGGSSATNRELDALAVERYLDDDEWEVEERRAGRGPGVRTLPFPFPIMSMKSKGKMDLFSESRDISSSGRWWQNFKG